MLATCHWWRKQVAAMSKAEHGTQRSSNRDSVNELVDHGAQSDHTWSRPVKETVRDI